MSSGDRGDEGGDGHAQYPSCHCVSIGINQVILTFYLTHAPTFMQIPHTLVFPLGPTDPRVRTLTHSCRYTHVRARTHTLLQKPRLFCECRCAWQSFLNVDRHVFAAAAAVRRAARELQDNQAASEAAAVQRVRGAADHHPTHRLRAVLRGQRHRQGVCVCVCVSVCLSVCLSVCVCVCVCVCACVLRSRIQHQ